MTSKLFHRIENAHAVVFSGGVYKQCAVYRRDHELYVAVKGGFVGLRDRGGTTAPKLLWDHLELPAGDFYGVGRFGKLLWNTRPVL